MAPTVRSSTWRTCTRERHSGAATSAHLLLPVSNFPAIRFTMTQLRSWPEPLRFAEPSVVVGPQKSGSPGRAGIASRYTCTGASPSPLVIWGLPPDNRTGPSEVRSLLLSAMGAPAARLRLALPRPYAIHRQVSADQRTATSAHAQLSSANLPAIRFAIEVAA
jgi:hypothetical protein